MQDSRGLWPGLISMPDHVILGRRLKQLVAKFRTESTRNAAVAKKVEKERAEAASKQKKFLADMERHKCVLQWEV